MMKIPGIMALSLQRQGVGQHKISTLLLSGRPLVRQDQAREVHDGGPGTRQGAQGRRTSVAIVLELSIF